jgi:formylglycine-generating enzyme required for sulfatase activity
VNECDSPGAVCTAAYNVCSNTAGSWECACAGGYTGLSIIGGNTTCEPGLGGECTSDSQCPADTWCSTVAGYRRCAPRVFEGEAHQMDFAFVPAGTFLQGTPGGTGRERPYTATISRNYFVSRTEVTQGQWKAATAGVNPSFNPLSDNLPVEQVDWYSTLAYANWLSVNEGLSACYTFTGCSDVTGGWQDGAHSGCTGATFTGLDCTGYRLLAETEWERAARGGTTSSYFWGESTATVTVSLYAWYDENGGRSQPVGGLQQNIYGLHDVSGNVWEWVWDRYALGYVSGSATDYLGPSAGSARVFRGGSFSDQPINLRSAFRPERDPTLAAGSIGFRLARTAY